jgi:large subunit ribosomal protein L15
MNDEPAGAFATFIVHRSSFIARSEIMELSNLKPKKGARHAKKRVGRGPGSGHGKTAARGEKGQKSRSGFSRMRGFEGGQMPLHRRLPKRGFTNIFKKEHAVVNVSDLERFDNGATVDESALRQAGLVKGKNDGIKILGDGKLSKTLTVSATKFSKSAKAAIEAAGGTCQEIQ